jgi:predicted component of type VI protein secretion system
MFVARLFDRLNPDRPLSAHMLAEGVTRIGRDPNADWAIPDPDCEISRQHLELICQNGALLLKPLGANGVFRDPGGARLPDGEAVPVAPGDAINFGRYRLVVEPAPSGDGRAAAGDATMVFAAPFGLTTAVPTDWADGAALPPIDEDGLLLDAFCEGARLDVSALSNEDPAEIMRRVGHIYRQMVLGLGDLISERSTTRIDLQMDRTTIGARDNNPFKWAPSRKLAIDLLLDNEAGFLSGAEAIKASFEDVKRHMLGTLSGFGAALRSVLQIVSPGAIERRLEGQSSFLKSRAASCWIEYEKAHAEATLEVLEERKGPVSRAFLAAYEERVRGNGPTGLPGGE